MKVAVAAAISGFVLALVGIGAAVLGAELAHKEDEPSLAERVSAACREGYYVVDFTVGDEFNQLPEGVVEVMCESRKLDRYGVPDVYTTAVER